MGVINVHALGVLVLLLFLATVKSGRNATVIDLCSPEYSSLHYLNNPDDYNSEMKRKEECDWSNGEAQLILKVVRIWPGVALQEMDMEETADSPWQQTEDIFDPSNLVPSVVARVKRGKWGRLIGSVCGTGLGAALGSPSGSAASAIGSHLVSHLGGNLGDYIGDYIGRKKRFSRLDLSENEVCRRVNLAFNLADKDGNGVMSIDEIRAVGNTTRDDIERMLMKRDRNMDQQLQLNEISNCPWEPIAKQTRMKRCDGCDCDDGMDDGDMYVIA